MNASGKEITSKVLTKRVFATTLASIVLSVSLYGLMMPFALNFDKKQGFSFVLEIFSAMTVLGPLAALAVLLFFKPASDVIKKLEKKEIVLNKDFIKARKALKRIPVFLFFVGASSYILGTAMNYLPSVLKHETVDYAVLVGRIFAGLSWGIVTGVLCGRMLNITLIEAKAQLRIYTIEQMKGEKFQNIRNNAMLPIMLSFVFYIIFITVAFYFGVSTMLGQQNVHIAAMSASGSNPAEISGAVKDVSVKLFNQAIIRFAILCGAVLLILLMLIYIVILEITSHLKNLSMQITQLAEGEMDLTRRINIVSFDDVGIMTAGFNSIIQKLNATFIEIRKLIQNVYETSQVMNDTVIKSTDQSSKMGTLITEVESSISDQVETISKTAKLITDMMPVIESSIEKIGSQSLAVETTSQGITEIIKSIGVIDQSASREEEIYRDVVQMIESGSTMIENSIQAMEAIEQTSHKITDIVGIISNIADSTNILAMNAAIEAAHAGEFGKGFAIVSSEIRSLAEGTSKSTDDIETLIGDMTQKITNGVSAFAGLKDILEQMIRAMRDTGTYITGITSQTREQSEKASKHLEDIGSLVEMTGALKSNTQSQKTISLQLDGALVQLNEAATSVMGVNAALTESMVSITEAFDKIHESSSNTFSDIKRLEDQISTFRLGYSDTVNKSLSKEEVVLNKELEEMTQTYDINLTE